MELDLIAVDAVRVDVVDVAYLDAARVERRAHAAILARRVLGRSCDVVGVARHAIPMTSA